MRAGRPGNTFRRKGPVSYTHLDVYKRQAIRRAAASGFLAAAGPCMSFGFLDKLQVLRHALEAGR